MKKVKYVFLFVLCLVLSLGSSVTVLAEDYSTYPYYIKNYDVNITVNEDNSCHITENIDCFLISTGTVFIAIFLFTSVCTEQTKLQAMSG